MYRQYLPGVFDGGKVYFVKFHAGTASTTLPAALAAGSIHKDVAHGLTSGGEKMAATFPMRRLLHIHQPEVGFMHQGGRLERLARFLLGQLLRREVAQLLVNQG